MGGAVTLLRVFISSPGDVAQERAVARRVLGRVQGAYANRLKLEPVLWEQQPLLATDTFQSQLVRPSQTDIVLGILWSRLGTPLPVSIQRADGSSFRSGTEFEIEDALATARTSARPRVMLYRKTAEPSRWFATAADAVDAAEQREALEAFLTRLLRSAADGSFVGAFHPFRSTAEFEELLELHLHKLVRELVPALAESDLPAVASWAFGSPFRGLHSFELEHAPVFFGRTAATAAAVERLQEQARRGAAFLLLLGMSGGGKSSLAKAGILHMLMQPGVVEGVRAWRWTAMRPGDGRGDLLLALAAALIAPSALPGLGATKDAVAGLRATPAESAASIAAALDAPGGDDGDVDGKAHLVLIVDQLEEIFSDANVTTAEREAFVRVLDALVRSGRVWVVATLRSDFYPRCVELPELLALKEGAGQFDVLPPGSAEIAQMIRMPAAAAGLRFDQDATSGERLDESLRDVMLGRPAALPLLEFTLEELYQRRTAEGLLTYAAYAAFGGLEGALAHRAESVYAAEPPEVQAALPRVLDPLVSIGEDDDGMGGRHAPLEAFADSAARRLVQALIDARLLVSDLASDGVVHVSVAHEALFRHWPRVVEWLDANRELLRIRERVSAAASRWVSEEHRADYLLQSGKPFAEAILLRDSGMRLEPLEHEFVVASGRRDRRNRNLRRGAIAALAVLTVAASVAAVLAVRQAEIARRETTTASRTSDFLTSLFAVVDPSEDRGSKVTARELLDRGAVKIRTELRDEPLIRAGLLNTMGSAYSGLGLYDPALRLTAEAREDRVRQLGRFHPDTLRSQNAYAAVLYLSAEYKQAEAAYREAQTIAAHVHPRGDAERTRSSIGLADVLAADGRPDEAKQLYRAAIAELNALAGDTRRDRVFALSGLGTALYFQSQLDEAEAAFQQAIELGSEALGKNHPKVAETVNNLGSIAYQKADYARARRLWEQALPIYREIFGADHAEVASVLNNLGRVALIERRFLEAEQWLGEALNMDRRFKSAGHDDLILPLNSLGLARMGVNDYARASESFDEALAIARQHDHWMLGVVLTNVADLKTREGDLAAAERAASESRVALERAFPPETRKDEGWRYELLGSVEAAILSSRGRRAEAQPLLLAAIDPLAARFGESSLFAIDAMERALRHFEATGDQRASQVRERLRRAQRQPKT